MCRKLIYLVSFVLVLCLVGDVQAADVTWTDASGDHLWSTAVNWDTGTLPTSADTVKIRILPGPTVANQDAVANVVQPAAGNSTGDLTVDGGTLTITDRLVVAQNAGSNGTLNMISGTITVGGRYAVGRYGSGTLNMTGGTITVGGTLQMPEMDTGTAHANLHGGIITADNLEMRAAGGVGTIDIRTGTLIINGDKLSTVQGYIDNGWITAYDGNGTLHLDYDFTNPGKTTITAFELTSAFNPIPAYGATDAPRDAVLSWTPGVFANTHDVYFGTTFNDVNDADRTNPLGVLASQGQNAGTYDPGRLDFSQIYYWRVDEVNAPPDYTIYKGDVWQFTVEPFAYPIAGTSITATASSSNSADEGPENTINGSGLDADDLHSTENTAMWLSSTIGQQPTWVQYEFDKVYKLHQMLVWNHNSSLEPVIGFGIKEAAIEYSTDGSNWTTLGTTHEFARASGTAGSPSNTTVDLSNVVAKYIKITANSNWGGILKQYGLSEVRFLYIPVLAREPNPASGTIDAAVDNVTLSWRAGREAASHKVYFSDSNQAVIDGTAPVTTVSQARYGPLSLDLGKTYYWRIDEVNEARTPTTWQGDVLNFTTREFLIVDDFEDYNDFEPDRIFDTWIDGWNVPTNGSQVGSAEPPFAEQTIVHGGNQSMPLNYDNTTASYSEATANIANLKAGRDWTKYGIKSLSLWFYGDPTNAVEQMYVKLNGSKVTYGGDAASLTRATWQTWDIELSSFSVSLSNVTELSIGLERSGAVGGKGVVYFDDIRLYPLREPGAH